MRVKFIQGIVSIFGTFEPGQVTDVPIDKVAESWIRNGIAKRVPGGRAVEIKPALPIPPELMEVGIVDKPVPEGEEEADPEGELEAFPVPVDEAPEEPQEAPQVEEKPAEKKTTRGKKKTTRGK